MKGNISRPQNQRTHFFSRIAVVFLAAIICGQTGPVRGQNAAASNLTDLRAAIAARLDQPRFSGALWGVKIVSLDTGETLFEDHPDRLMSPASNSKLYTGALALDRWGGDYRIATPVFVTVAPDANGVVAGDLIVSGRADPSWNVRRAGTNFWGLFDPFVTVLKKAGVRQVTGDVIGDATFLHSSPAGSGWTVEDADDSEGAEISALTLEDNYTQVRVTPGAMPGEKCKVTLLEPGTGLMFDNQTVTVTNGGLRHLETHHLPDTETIHLLGVLPAGGEPEVLDVAVPRPARWFATALKAALIRQGIAIGGGARDVTWPAAAPAGGIKLGEVLSPLLRDLVHDFMKPSQNLETDLIFEYTGESLRSADTVPWTTSEDLAVAALQHFLRTNGLPAGELHFEEGSGLSRNNLTSAELTVALLKFMATHREGSNYLNALPIAGVDGTLRRRMKGTPAEGNVRAKTGTLRWVNSLSGFVTTAAGEKLAFSLMLNRYAAPPGTSSRDDLDAIAVLLAKFGGRSDGLPMAQYAALGQLVITQLVSAPFPHPARAAGHMYHGQLYSAVDHYNKSTVAIFIPKTFRPGEKVDLVVHFHGWNHTVASTLPEYMLIEQFAASERNAILVVPEGPYNAPDSFGGKLEDTNGFKNFIAEVGGALRMPPVLATNQFQIGDIIISGHSGGYHVMGEILDHGGLADKIKEVWLFDALYGSTPYFVAWQQAYNGRLLDIYTDHGGTKEETEKLMSSLKTAGTGYWAGEDAAMTPEILRANRLVFIHTDMVHNDVVGLRSTYQKFLETSCLP